MKLVVLVVAAIAAGCVSDPPLSTTIVRCPPLASYDDREQSAAADQLSFLPAGSPVRVMIKDYGDLRAQCRAVEGATMTR